jgi:hypothetical protein
MSRKAISALAIGIVLGASAVGIVSTVRAESPATEVRTEGKLIAFIVEGREVARIDASGFMVSGAITHSGALISTNGGPAFSASPAQDGDR